jgi:hypothetical protein
MTHPITLAKTAREGLAQGLSALQGPGVPDALGAVAEPVAQAMSALHHIESSQGAALHEAAPQALESVRRALAMLQAQAGLHPAVDQATEAVANSLGHVHSLAQGAPTAPPAHQQGFAQPAFAAAQPAPVAQPAMQQQAPSAQQPAAYGAGGYPQQPGQFPHAQPAPVQGGAPGAGSTYVMDQPAAAAGGWGAPPQQAAPPAAQQPQPQAGYGAYGAPPPAASSAPAWPEPPAQAPAGNWGAAPGSNPHAASNPQAAPSAPHAAQPFRDPPPDAKRIEANLGAHSATNFYKGLSGNDVIDAGGIFVATYQMPEIGDTVLVHVNLPGGYEFEALGVVEWTREAPLSSAGPDAPPGFGAKFTQISPEGRQLVYRYVRNREPLFHDDL